MARIRKDEIIAGNTLVAKYYPTYNASVVRIPEAPKKTQKSKEQMDIENKNRAIKRFVLKALNNFDENDFIITCEYLPQFAPDNEAEFKKDIRNFIDRVKYHRAKKGLSNKFFKYHLAVACSEFKTGYKKGQPRYHFHGFITSGGMTSDEIKALWKFGAMGRVERFNPDMYGPEGWAIYCAQQATGRRKFISSTNCTMPEVKEKKNTRISKKKLSELAEKRIDDKEYWEKQYQGYSFVRMEANYNDYNGYYYVIVVMYKPSTKQSYYARSRERAKPNLSFAHIKRGVY